MSCIMTLNGQCCEKLTDIVTFISQLKDLDLAGENNYKCCNNGTSVKKGTTANGVAVTQDCLCPDELEQAQEAYTCVFDNCISWTELREWLNRLKTAWTNNDLAPAGVAAFAALWGFFGAVGPTGVLKDALPIFYQTSGGLLGIVTGVLGAVYAGMATINAAIKTDFSSTATGVGTTFLNYGGFNVAGDLLGVIEMSWVIAYLILCMFIAMGPFGIAWEMDKAFRLVSLPKRHQKSYDYMFIGLLTGVGAWGGAVALQQSATKLIGFFDIQRADTGAYNQAQLSKTLQEATWTPIVVDVVHHTATILGYWLLAWAITGGSYTYGYYFITAPADATPYAVVA